MALENGVIYRSATRHMSISVQGALKAKPSELAGYMSDEYGREYSGRYVYEMMKKADWEGKKVLPIGDCDNFCDQKGCRGHDVVLVVHDWHWETGNG